MVRWFRDRSHLVGIPSVSLRRLLPEARFVGCRDLEASGCTTDSRRVEPGQVFFAVPEEKGGPTHERRALRALERGAVGVVAEQEYASAGPFQVIVPDSRQAHARLCHALAGDPARQLDLIVVAGATGRTAAAVCLRSILEAHGARYGSIGALGWSDGVRSYPAGTPGLEVDVLAQMLAGMVERHCAGAVIELPPEALRQRFASSLGPIQAAIVTDLAPTGTLEGDVLQRRDHARLVKAVAPEGVVVLDSDDQAVHLLSAANLDARLVSVALGQAADVQGNFQIGTPVDCEIGIRSESEELFVRSHYHGRCLARAMSAAAALAWARGIPTETIREGLEAVGFIPGQLRRARGDQPFGVWISSARSVPCLRESLETIRGTYSGRLRCVVITPTDGLSEEEVLIEIDDADQIIVTTDGSSGSRPRSSWMDTIEAGRRPAGVEFIPNVDEAIAKVSSDAGPDDAVLIISSDHPQIQRDGRRIVVRDAAEIATNGLRHSTRKRQRCSV